MEIPYQKRGDRTKFWCPHLQMIHPKARIGMDCIVHAFVWAGPGVRIGDRCQIQAGCFLPELVTIGNDCFLGPHVVLTNDPHPPSGAEHWLPTVVGNNVSIGANATIKCGITIGDNAVIGMGAVVTKDVKAGTVVVGNPARELKRT